MKKEENEKYEIDEKELIKQHFEDIENKGKFAEVRVVIETGSTQCIPSVIFTKVTIKEVAFLINSLQTILKKIESDFPEASLLSKFADIDIEKFGD